MLSQKKSFKILLASALILCSSKSFCTDLALEFKQDFPQQDNDQKDQQVKQLTDRCTPIVIACIMGAANGFLCKQMEKKVPISTKIAKMFLCWFVTNRIRTTAINLLEKNINFHKNPNDKKLLEPLAWLIDWITYVLII